MCAAPRTDIRLKIPGFRRYATVIERQRRKIRELEALRERLAAAEKFEYYWTNAHKKIDPLDTEPFGPIAQKVLADGRTFLKVDRLYTLWQAVAGMPAGAAAVVEIGTYRGGSARMLAESLLAAGRRMPMYTCDTFAGHTAVDKKIDGRHRVGEQFTDVSAADVAAYLAAYDFVEVVEGDIRETARRFADQQAFGMIHIDVDVYRITAFCLEFFAPRVIPGAMIVVDDYGLRTCPGVRQAVDEFAAARPQTFRVMHLLSAQAVLTRVA